MAEDPIQDALNKSAAKSTPSASSSSSSTSSSQAGSGLDPNIASALAYLLGLITGIVFLLVEKDNKQVRFHAWQATIFGGAWFAFSIILAFFTAIFWSSGIMLGMIGLVRLVVSLLGFVLWIVFMVKAYKGERLTIPFITDMAEKMNNR